MGNPDLPTPEHIVEKLTEVAKNPKSHRYSASAGIRGLRLALSAYYERRFNVTINPDEECVVTLGSKEGLANLASAMTSPGDIVLTPNPSYPIHPFGFIIADGSVQHLPVKPDESFLIALSKAIKQIVPKPVALILNYPSNPTALIATYDFFSEVVSFCKANNIWILSDLAYAEIYFDEKKPPSILQVPGAKEIAVEFTSMSKSYSMPGWRIGFVAGNKYLVSALTRIKSYLDYGAFTPIQVAAAAALNGPQDCVDEIRKTYKERRDVLINGLSQAGWDVPIPPATMFAWAPLPEKFKSIGAMEFSKLLLKEANVAVSPGTGFGDRGEGHVRIALVENKHRIRQATRSIKQFLSDSERILSTLKK